MKLDLKFVWLLLLPFTLASCAPSTPAHAAVVLVDKVTPPCPIIADTKGNALEARVAQDLAKYLKKINGHEFVVQAPSENLPTRAIVVGAHGIAAPNELGPDGFLIKTQGQRIFIVGGGEKGTAYGVYAFLENQLGCRFWSWDEESVPKKDVLKLGELDIREQPAFALHDIMSQEAQTDKNNFQYKSRAKATLQFTGGNNTLFNYLKPYYKEHPEFLPLNEKGERKFNNLHLNYLAPSMPEVLATEIEKDVKKRKGNITDWIYALGQGDWYGGLDQSPESKAVYAEEAWTDPHGIKRAGLVAPLLQMANKTSELLQKDYPGIRIGIFPYMSVDSPPGKTVPAPNVDIYLPRLRYGITLSVEEAASDANPNEKSRRKSQMIKDSIEQWTKLAPGRMFIWEYGVNYNNFVKPLPDLRAMAQNIKYYHRIGVTGVMIQGNYTGFGGDLVVLKNWIWSKLLWNPDLDTDALLKEFCDGYYGPAAAEMMAYVNTLEDSVRKPAYAQYDEFYDGSAYLTKEVRTTLNADLDTAKAKVQSTENAEYLRRVHEAAASLDALRLWTDKTDLVEKDSQLVRADRGGAYTHDDAEILMNSLRGAGITEWSHPLSQQRAILPLNGGPLYTLSQGAVTAKIAPYQGHRRLWRVLLEGRTVINGSYASVAGRYFEPVGTPTADKIVISGELGYGSWDPKAYQLESDTFTQDADGTLRWNAQLKQLDKKQSNFRNPMVGTSYPAKDLATAQRYLVEAKTAAGWKAVAINTLKSVPDAKAMQKPDAPDEFQLRITTPDKKVVILDSYGGLPVSGYAIGFGTLYNSISKAKEVGLLTYVQCGAAKTEFGKDVPAFQRTIQVQPAP